MVSDSRKRIRVLHAFRGCDTGCCGHVIEVDGKQVGDLDLSHPYGASFREYAEDLIRKELGDDHVRDLDWETCEVLDD